MVHTPGPRAVWHSLIKSDPFPSKCHRMPSVFSIGSWLGGFTSSFCSLHSMACAAFKGSWDAEGCSSPLSISRPRHTDLIAWYLCSMGICAELSVTGMVLPNFCAYMGGLLKWGIHKSPWVATLKWSNDLGYLHFRKPPAMSWLQDSTKHTYFCPSDFKTPHWKPACARDKGVRWVKQCNKPTPKAPFL